MNNIIDKIENEKELLTEIGFSENSTGSYDDKNNEYCIMSPSKEMPFYSIQGLTSETIQNIWKCPIYRTVGELKTVIRLYKDLQTLNIVKNEITNNR